MTDRSPSTPTPIHLPPQSKSPRRQIFILIASSISCSITMTLCNPLQVAKLKSQYSPIACPLYPHPSFRQLYSCQCTKFKISDTFKGLSINLFHGLISNTLYMQFYQYLRQISIHHLPSSIATLSSAMLSRLMVTTIMIPIESFRVRYTNSTEKHQITKSKLGLKVSLARDLTYSGLYWFTIQQIRNLIIGAEYRQQHPSNKNLYANIIPPMIGGSLVSLITTPFDTIKTRLQSGVDMTGTLREQLKRILKKQGYIGLFSGVQHRVMRNTITSVLYLSIFQKVIQNLQTRKYPFILF